MMKSRASKQKASSYFYAHVDAFSADANVNSEKLHEWRMRGINASVIDLRSVYIQVHVVKSL